MDIEIYSSSSEEETFQIGIELSTRLVPGDLIAFHGDLGAGKTELIKGICHGLDVQEIVSSPTYTIINQYVGREKKGKEIDVYHVDLYRVESPAELPELGLAEIVEDPYAIKLVEWAENAEAILPPMRYNVYLTSLTDENSRRIEIVRRTPADEGRNGTVRAYTTRLR